MKREEMIALPGSNNPVLCADGKLAMLILYPGPDGKCGVQVHGEEDIRWIDSADVTSTPGGALRETGAPDIPPPQSDMVQRLLAMDFAKRG